MAERSRPRPYDSKPRTKIFAKPRGVIYTTVMTPNYPLLLRYDPETGQLFRRFTGKPIHIRRHKDGPRIEVQGQRVRVRAVIWFLMTGNWPKPRCVIAPSGDLYDLRWSNFREIAPTRVRPPNRCGLTEAEYAQRLAEQGGGCFLCGAPPGKRRLAVDHCHKTGTIRKLLCRKCNTGLGVFKDDPRTLLRAAQYLLGRLPLPSPNHFPTKFQPQKLITPRHNTPKHLLGPS